MKHLELHIIQSVPVSCLNRDDLNSPKTAIFGGTQRSRVSSQCWKRAIREMAKEIKPELFQGQRTKLLYEPLVEELKILGMEDSHAEEGAKKLVDALVKIDSKSKDVVKASTLYFASPLELKTLAETYFETQDVKKSLKSISNGKALSDAADISIFGRMVANDHSLTVEAASMFAHAISTHTVDNEIDFFTAVDDLQTSDESGSGMMGTLEFNSATYYRFAALNIDMLFDKDHLENLSIEDRKNVIRVFIESTIKAMPGARKNTMNGNTLPLFVLGIIREKGHPIQLINAFEEPIRTITGYGLKSVELLKMQYEELKQTWGLEAIFEGSIPEVTLSEFLEGIMENV